MNRNSSRTALLSHCSWSCFRKFLIWPFISSKYRKLQSDISLSHLSCKLSLPVWVLRVIITIKELWNNHCFLFLRMFLSVCGGNAGTQTQLVLALANILSLSLTPAFSLPRVHKRVKWLSIYKTGILEESILPCSFLSSLFFFLYALLFNGFISIFLQIGLYYSKLQT